MNILALDLGTKTGWARSIDGTLLESDVESFAPGRHESQGMRMIRFEQWLSVMLISVDLVVYEAVGFAKTTHAAHVYGGFLAFLQAACIKRQVEYVGVHVTALKRFATGRGNAGKPAMVEAANRFEPGSQITDHNRADAICLLQYALRGHIER